MYLLLHQGSEAMASTTGLSDNIQDEFYFLTDPHEFIYNHLPNQQGWQLLARPVTKPEFEVKMKIFTD